jgi:pimeloyl-ACP methyl ester carboxylesterase
MHPEMNPVSALPGIVIFIHGVNDPGGNYDVIEKGLCEGLCERLDAFRLFPGEYGKKYAQAKTSKAKLGDEDYEPVAKVKYDPDTYLYERTEVEGEVGKATHSIFIPFYWGYRASREEIGRKPPGEGGDKDGYETVRGQYQDKFGNRLSKHFAKGGGMFNNATNSIPPMFGPGFHDSVLNKGASLAMSPYEYSGKSPHRRYMVLAAERLAMLVRDIRAVAADDTITIIGHSQGTLITLLAQALLIDGAPERTLNGKAIPAIAAARPADCLILVDSPYSLSQQAVEAFVQPGHPLYSVRGKLNTLINLVDAVTSVCHPSPDLASLSPHAAERRDHGRAGYGWKGVGPAVRRERDGTLIDFIERDNRGKVYMYFCPEDGTVQLPNIQGMGSEGIPDSIHESHRQPVDNRDPLRPIGVDAEPLPAMSALAAKRFYQRVWTRSPEDLRGNSTALGSKAGYLEFSRGQKRLINGEEISPPYAANMYGGEVVQGSPTTRGLITPNDYAKDLLIGNRDASMPMIPIGMVDGTHSPAAAEKAKFNANKGPDDQTYMVHVTRMSLDMATGVGTYMVERDETPNEARARMETRPIDRQTNSYHSAALSHADNLRRVVAMDVAIGQAKALDDPDWRRLFIALADWKITKEKLFGISENPRFSSLTEASRALFQASLDYYTEGFFPVELVSTRIPSMIDAESVSDRTKERP